MIAILTIRDLIDSAKSLPARDVEIKHVTKRLIVLEARIVLYSRDCQIKVLKDVLYPANNDTCWPAHKLDTFLEDRL